MNRFHKVVFALSFWLSVTGAAQTNLVQNGGFEQGKEGRPEHWQLDVEKESAGDFILDLREKHEGAASLKVIHRGEHSEWMRVSQPSLSCKPNAVYRLDCVVKSASEARVLVYVFESGRESQPLTITVAGGRFPQWTPHTKIIRTSDKAQSLKISLAACTRGEAWFDAISLVNLGEPPSLVIPKTEDPPRVDGSLDEVAWEKAVMTRPFHLLGERGGLPRHKTQALLIYDDSHLYIAFCCDEPNPKGMRKSVKNRGGNVWEDDCIEVFLDIGRTKSTYMHFVANVLGVQYQALHFPPGGWATQWYDSGAKDEGTARWEARWSVKASVARNEWVAEIAFPFSELGRTPILGEVWHANFCRQRKVADGEEASCWAFLEGTSFHAPAQFGRIVFGGGEVKKPTVLAARPKRAGSSPIVPRPQQFSVTGASFEFTPEVAIFVPPDKPGALLAAQFFKDDVNTRGGYELQITTAPKALKDLIIFDHEPLSEVTSKFIASAQRRAEKGASGVPEQLEGYLLDVRSSVIVLAGRDARGVWNGAQTLRFLVRFEEEGVRVSGARVVDWPALPVRGWHLSAVQADELDAYRRLIDLFTLLKLNTLIIEVDNHMRYDRHPDIAEEKALTKSQLGELVAYARERQFEVIPQVQTFGHFQYVLQKEKYKHLAENPTPHPKWGLYTYCPSDPEVYKLVFDLFDEVIAVFKPKYFHIGHDEISFSDIGKCERCKAKSPKDLLAEDVKRLYDYLSAKGLKVLIWCDQFEVERNGGPPANTAGALPLLPKDIIICDWHYEPGPDFPSLKFFRDQGFPVIAFGWWKPRNVYDFTTAAAALRQDKGGEKILGYCGTTWCPTHRIREFPEMMTSIILTAENAWSPRNPPLDQMAYPPTDVFRRLYDFGAKEDVVKEFFTVDLRQRANASFTDTPQRAGWFGLGPDYDMSLMPGGMQWLCSLAGGREVPFDILSPSRAKASSCIILSNRESPKDGFSDRAWPIEIGEKAAALYFLHTTSRPREKPFDVNARYRSAPLKVGWYEITYQDGSKAQIDLIYGQNIADWNTRFGASEADVVWRGRTRAGALIQICAYEWKNPKPAVPITQVDFISTRSEVSPVLIAITGKR